MSLVCIGSNPGVIRNVCIDTHEKNIDSIHMKKEMVRSAEKRCLRHPSPLSHSEMRTS